MRSLVFLIFLLLAGAAQGGEIRFIAYLTAYGQPDNDPPGSDTTYISGIEGHAGGTGVYDDPITLAVGYVGERVDFPVNTRFYIPNVQAYFIVRDKCQACHTKPAGTKAWLDLWLGGKNASKEDVLACANQLTGNYLVIQNPEPNYKVTTGPLFHDGMCREPLGNVILMS